MQFNTSNVLETAFLYADGSDGFSRYEGELPKGLKFEDVRYIVEQKCGPSLKSRGSEGIIPYWVNYDGFLVTYTLPSETDLMNKIHNIAISKPFPQEYG